jgi:hypothetical protein
MYKCKSPKVVYNPYQILPSFGENEIETSYIDSNLLLKITFDDAKTGQEDSLEIEFEHAVFFKVASCPGIDGMDIEYEYGDKLSSLIEFTDSEFKIEWEKHFNNLYKLHHYKILFLSANKSLEVVSEGFRIIGGSVS